jgi:hypothetical protein
MLEDIYASHNTMFQAKTCSWLSAIAKYKAIYSLFTSNLFAIGGRLVYRAAVTALNPFKWQWVKWTNPVQATPLISLRLPFWERLEYELNHHRHQCAWFDRCTIGNTSHNSRFYLFLIPSVTWPCWLSTILQKMCSAIIASGEQGEFPLMSRKNFFFSQILAYKWHNLFCPPR